MGGNKCPRCLKCKFTVTASFLKLIIVHTGVEKYPFNREIFDPKMYTYSFVSLSKRCFLY